MSSETSITWTKASQFSPSSPHLEFISEVPFLRRLFMGLRPATENSAPAGVWYIASGVTGVPLRGGRRNRTRNGNARLKQEAWRAWRKWRPGRRPRGSKVSGTWSNCTSGCSSSRIHRRRRGLRRRISFEMVCLWFCCLVCLFLRSVSTIVNNINVSGSVNAGNFGHFGIRQSGQFDHHKVVAYYKK